MKSEKPLTDAPAETFVEDEGLPSDRIRQQASAVALEGRIKELLLVRREGGELLSNVAIANRLGCKPSDVAAVRQRCHLAAPYEPTPEPAPETETCLPELLASEEVTEEAVPETAVEPGPAAEDGQRPVSGPTVETPAAERPAAEPTKKRRRRTEPAAPRTPQEKADEASRAQVTRLLLDLFTWENEAEQCPLLADLAVAIRSVRLIHRTHTGGA